MIYEIAQEIIFPANCRPVVILIQYGLKLPGSPVKWPGDGFNHNSQQVH